jgi:hypothetical protein
MFKRFSVPALCGLVLGVLSLASCARVAGQAAPETGSTGQEDGQGQMETSIPVMETGGSAGVSSTDMGTVWEAMGTDNMGTGGAAMGTDNMGTGTSYDQGEEKTGGCPPGSCGTPGNCTACPPAPRRPR